jgi:(S)-2-hydroxyglutarate dehydrogenase
MLNNLTFDIVVTGGGIIGTSSAMHLCKVGVYSIGLIETEEKLAMHQTGNNSGVIHSGLYYKPGSLKAQNCTEGRELLYNFCSEHNIPHEKCGKVVAAINEKEIPALDELERRGNENGLKYLQRLSPRDIKNIEPNVSAIDGLFVPQTGIVDYKIVTNKYAEVFRRSGGKVLTGTKLISITREKNSLLLKTSKGKINCRFLVNCGGLYSDKIAALTGVDPEVRIVPFRGEYYKLKKNKENLVKNLVYPVPDPEFPFLGVHFTRMINGGVEAGPNAVLAFKREGYKKTDFSLSETAGLFLYPGFIKMAAKYYRMGFGEFYRSYNKKAFVAALQKLIPAISAEDLIPGGSGVRAQALNSDGKLIDDFCIVTAENAVNILNAPSPAATASLSIGKKIANIVSSSIN